MIPAAWEHHLWCLSELKRLGFKMPHPEPTVNIHAIQLHNVPYWQDSSRIRQAGKDDLRTIRFW